MPTLMNRDGDWRVVTVKEVNTVSGHIETRDQFDTPIMVDLTNKPAFFQMPAVGEVWTVQRRGSDWLLGDRIDDPNVTVPQSSMKPGDARIEAPGTIWITSKRLPLQARYGTATYGGSYYTGFDVYISGDTQIDENLEVTGNLDVEGDLNVDGTTILKDIAVTGSFLTGTPGDLFPNWIKPTADEIIGPDRSVVVGSSFEIGVGHTLEIGAGGNLTIV